MTDRELVIQLLSMLHEHAARVRRRRKADLTAFRNDVDAQDALSMSFLVATQAAVDVAFHISSDEAWGVPASYAEAFELLARNGVIDDELSRQLRGVVAVRHRVAHVYGSLDIDRFWSELPAGVAALERFAASVARFVGEAPSQR